MSSMTQKPRPATLLRAASPCCGAWVYRADQIGLIGTSPALVRYVCRGCEAEVIQPATPDDVRAVVLGQAELGATTLLRPQTERATTRVVKAARRPRRVCNRRRPS